MERDSSVTFHSESINGNNYNLIKHDRCKSEDNNNITKYVGQ